MLSFNKLTLENADVLRAIYSKYNNGLADYSLFGFFAYRDLFNTEFAILGNNVILRIHDDTEINYCMPLGENVDIVLDEIIKEYSTSNNKLCFYPILEKEIPIFDKYFEYEVKKYENWCDYVYNVDDLKELSGRKYHTQKNHLNYFKNNFKNYSLSQIDEKDLEVIKTFTKNLEDFELNLSKYHKAEFEHVFDALNNFNIYGFRGMKLEVDGKLVGYILGEVLNKTLFIHIQKCDKSYRGSFQFLMTEFIKSFDEEINNVNLEDDAADIDLKNTKLRYHPKELLVRNKLYIKRIK